MPKIKIHPADSWFSKCIREAADWTCEAHEYCGFNTSGKFEEGSQGLHCSHYFGRGGYGTRFAVENCDAHCFACHQKLGSNPDDFTRWKAQKYGEGMIGILREKRNDIGLAKAIKKNLKDVAKHYREEHKRLKQLRAEGITGKLDVIGYE